MASHRRESSVDPYLNLGTGLIVVGLALIAVGLWYGSIGVEECGSVLFPDPEGGDVCRYLSLDYRKDWVWLWVGVGSILVFFGMYLFIVCAPENEEHVARYTLPRDDDQVRSEQGARGLDVRPSPGKPHRPLPR